MTNDFVYKPSSAQIPIIDRLEKRRSWRTRVPVVLKPLHDILSPQPEAMRVIKKLLCWIDQCDVASQRGERKPDFETPDGDPIFPPKVDGEAVLWWLTDLSRNNQQQPVAPPDESRLCGGGRGS